MNRLAITLSLSAFTAFSLPAIAGGPTRASSEAPVAAAEAPIPSDPWSGAWAGLSLGSGRSTYDMSVAAVTPIPGLGLGLNLPDFGGMGGIAGVELGYNHRVGDNVLLGIQLGHYKSEIETDASLSLGLGGPPVDFDYHYRTSSMTSVLGRIGYLVNDNTMLFALAGMSRAQFDGAYSSSIGFNGGYGIELNGTTLGAGIETLLTDNLSVRLDYRVTKFDDYNLIDTFIGPVDISADLETNVQSVNGTLVLRF